MKRALCIWLPHWPSQRRAAEPCRTTSPSDDPLADQQALESLAKWCMQFSPSVAVEPSATPDSLLLDITGLGHLYGGETALAEKIVGSFAQRGLGVRVSIADTSSAAWAVAHYAKKDQGGSALKNCQWQIVNSTPPTSLASRPPSSSFLVVPPGQTAAMLRVLPLEALRLPQPIIPTLRSLGIDQIGQLESLPREDFLSRFGPQLLERLDQAMGRRPEPLPLYQPPPELGAQWLPEHPTTRRDFLETALEELTRQVSGKLLLHGLGAMQLQCQLDCLLGVPSQIEPVRVSVGLFQPTASARHLFQLMQMQFDQLRLPAPVAAMQLTATATASLPYRQQKMFFCNEDPCEQNAFQLASLIDRLSIRLGRQAVACVRLLPEAQPELAWQYMPLIAAPALRGSRRRKPQAIATDRLPRRPLRLLSRPVRLLCLGEDTAARIKLWQPAPAASQPLEKSIEDREAYRTERPAGIRKTANQIARDGPCFRATANKTAASPLRFHFHGSEHQVVCAWGPERIETGWWRGRPIGRDYYQIETVTGHRYWIFRRLNDGRWFMHGIFE